MTLRHHVLELFPVTLHAAYSLDDWNELRGTTIESLESDPGSKGHTSRDGVDNTHGAEDAHVSIYIAPNLDDLDRLRTVVHESVHAAHAILDHVGEQVSPWSETLAYLTDWIAAWVWEGNAGMALRFTPAA